MSDMFLFLVLILVLFFNFSFHNLNFGNQAQILETLQRKPLQCSSMKKAVTRISKLFLSTINIIFRSLLLIIFFRFIEWFRSAVFPVTINRHWKQLNMWFKSQISIFTWVSLYKHVESKYWRTKAKSNIDAYKI